MKETMTVTKALKELKLSNDKIASRMDKINPTFVTVGEKLNGVMVTPAEKEKWKREQKSILDSVKALIKRRDALKRAVVLSNAKEKVTIGEETMTIAEAIEKKNSIVYREQLLERLKQFQNQTRRTLENEKEVANESIHQMMMQFLGREKSNSSSKESEAQRKVFEEMFKIDLIEAYDVDEMINRLSKEIEEFELNVDDVLSVSNATTTIVINY